jgi:hypothetical protein
VEAVIETMRAEHDPLASQIFASPKLFWKLWPLVPVENL